MKKSWIYVFIEVNDSCYNISPPLAAMMVPRLSGRADQAKATVAQSDINASIATALKLYQLDNGNFPIH